MPDVRTVLPGAIRAERHRAGLTQQQLGERIGVGRDAISAIERATREVTAQELADIAAALNTTADLLLRDADPDQRLALGLPARVWWQT